MKRHQSFHSGPSNWQLKSSKGTLALLLTLASCAPRISHPKGSPDGLPTPTAQVASPPAQQPLVAAPVVTPLPAATPVPLPVSVPPPAGVLPPAPSVAGLLVPSLPPEVKFDAVLPTDPMALALTFDDGPDDYGNTKALVDVLKAANVPATFFINADNWSSITSDGEAEDTLRYIVANGFVLGNHSDHHCHMGAPVLNAAACNGKVMPIDATMATELSSVESKVQTVLGDPSFRFSQLRAPFGERGVRGTSVLDPNLVCTFAASGVHIGWGIDPLDYVCAGYFPAKISPVAKRAAQQRHTAAACTVNNMKQALKKKSGGVVLLHSDYPSTIDAVQQMIPLLRAQGYHFVAVEDFVTARYGVPSKKIQRMDRAACLQSLNADGLAQISVGPGGGS